MTLTDDRIARSPIECLARIELQVRQACPASAHAEVPNSRLGTPMGTAEDERRGEA